MSSRLRSLDSKISFFAFADIITAVSGVLIFVALLLATDLGLPTDSKETSQNQDLERQIEEVLAQQVEVDAQIERLQGLLTIANTSPDPEKLQADIKRLKSQFAEEQRKQAELLQQMAQSKAAIIKRDAELGLTSLKSEIEREKEKTKDIAFEVSEMKSQNAALDQHIAGLQSTLLQLRQREGKLWLIPEKGMTAKEPILAVVSSKGVSLERFDHPEKTKQIKSATVQADFESILNTMKTDNEYIVFIIRPSGISLFQELVKTARDRNIEVGFDAIEEDKDIYFTSPPVLDETVPISMPTGYTSGSGGYSEPSVGGGTWTETAGAASRGPAGFSGVPEGQAGRKNGDGSEVGFADDNNGSASGSKSNRAGAGTGPGLGGSGLGTGAVAGSGRGKDGGNENGRGIGHSDSGKSGNGSFNKGSAQVKTNTTSGDVKKDEPKTNTVSTPKSPATAAKSWWRRFLDWIWSFFK